jgi:DNA-binding transcriptional MerR regulator
LPDLFDQPSPPSQPPPRRPAKSAEAFRTISEVAGDLEVPQHVLRFWESKFPQIKPLKRAGGRRYYRPDDVALLRRIRQCLYEQGYTIKGVQKLLREGALKSGEAAVARGATSGVVAKPDDDKRDEVQELRDTIAELRSELAMLRDLLRRANQ